MFSTSDGIKTPMDTVRLWLHEASRVYGDKLVDDKDMEMLTKLKFEIAKNSFEVSGKKSRRMVMFLRNLIPTILGLKIKSSLP